MGSTPACAFASAHSTHYDPLAAFTEAYEMAKTELHVSPNLAILFFSVDYVPQAESLLLDIARKLPADCKLMACTGESIVGRGTELETGPAMSLWLAALPQCAIETVHLDFQRTPEGMAITGWPESWLQPWEPDSFLILLAEPFSFPADVLLEQLNEERRGVVMVGGVASGAHEQGGNRLMNNEKVFREGALLAKISGNVRLRTVVSQGCRPIGKPFVVTKADRNVIQQLGGKPALTQLQEIFAGLTQPEQALARMGLHLGRVVNEYLETFAQGDFLVRNVRGIDPASGAIVLTDYFRVGQTVQFHLRDHVSADKELRELLQQIKATSSQQQRGALLFTCNGLGTRLFPKQHHDARVIREILGDIPVAGFFAQGEIGPIGGRNFSHGFTASIAILEKRDS
jgi:small ligand-binding sensory domain FIST